MNSTVGLHISLKTDLADCGYSITDTAAMQENADHHAQTAAFAAARHRDRVNEYGNTTPTTETYWIGVALVSLATGWICFQYYQPEAGNLFTHGGPLVRAVFAIARRLITDLARFVLTILAITAELLLAGSMIGSFILRKAYAVAKRIVYAVWGPAATKAMQQYDAAMHSHNTNVARQRWRSIRSSASFILSWAAAICTTLVIITGPFQENDTSLEGLDIRSYVVPAWVIKARPENRPHDGSSSHYQPNCVNVRDIEQEREIYALLGDNAGPANALHDLGQDLRSISPKLGYAETSHSDSDSLAIAAPATVHAGKQAVQ